MNRREAMLGSLGLIAAAPLAAGASIPSSLPECSGPGVEPDPRAAADRVAGTWRLDVPPPKTVYPSPLLPGRTWDELQLLRPLLKLPSEPMPVGGSCKYLGTADVDEARRRLAGRIPELEEQARRLRSTGDTSDLVCRYDAHVARFEADVLQWQVRQFLAEFRDRKDATCSAMMAGTPELRISPDEMDGVAMGQLLLSLLDHDGLDEQIDGDAIWPARCLFRPYPQLSQVWVYRRACRSRLYFSRFGHFTFVQRRLVAHVASASPLEDPGFFRSYSREELFDD